MAWTPEQQQAIEAAESNVCVDAAAGSGKTSVLVEHILHLLEHKKAALDEIVAITFTEKAAAEMKERLRASCRDRESKANPAIQDFWRGLARQVETARMSTIHSFCASLLRENALSAGGDLHIDPDFSVLTEPEAYLLRQEVIADVTHRLLDEGNERALSVATEYGASTLAANLDELIRAGAQARRAAADEALADPETLLAAWSTRLEEALHERLSLLAHSQELRVYRAQLAAFDGVCTNPEDGLEIRRTEYLALLERIFGGLSPNKIANQTAALHGERRKRSYAKNWPDETVKKELDKVQGALKKLLQDQFLGDPDPEVEERSARLTCELAALYSDVSGAYSAGKQARTALDFDDLIEMALHMVETNGNVRRRVAGGIKYLLIDEFQDTDSAQLRMAQYLAGEENGPKLFIVGDAKQSIYRFRGAEVEVFKGAQEGHEIIPLDRNFRTVPEILEFVNDFFRKSHFLSAVEPDYRGITPHRSPAGACRVEYLIPGLEEDASHAGDARRAEAELIARWIAGAVSGTEVHVEEKGTGEMRPPRFGDMALLFRAMSDVALYEQALRKHGIPYQVVAGQGFYERQEVLDLRNLLTVVCDPCDEMALLGFLRSPMAGLSDDAMTALCSHGPLVTAFWGELPTGEFREGEALRAARSLLEDLRARAEMPLHSFLRYVLDRTGYEAMLAGLFMGDQRVCNVRKVVELAAEFSRVRRPRLSAFVRYLEEVAAEGIREGDAVLQSEDADEVTLMTVHKSKGLEYPVVIAPDLCRAYTSKDQLHTFMHRDWGLAAKVYDGEGALQHPLIGTAIKRHATALDLAEHARLLYVVMTRARDWLVLCGAGKPGKNSWAAMLCALYPLLEQKNRATVDGEGWSVRVVRELPECSLKPQQETSPPPPDREVLAKRIASAENSIPYRKTFAVTEILHEMADPKDSHQGSTGAAPQGGVDPRLRGTLVHKLFEDWDYSSGKAFDVEAFLLRECPARHVRKILQPDLGDIAARFAESDAFRMLAGAQQVQREAPFVLRVGDGLINGTIDALLNDGTILDYKTGRPHPERGREYEHQLRLYAAAVSHLLGVHPPAAFLYYVDVDKLEAVDVAPERIDETLALAKKAMATLRTRDYGLKAEEDQSK